MSSKFSEQKHEIICTIALQICNDLRRQLHLVLIRYHYRGLICAALAGHFTFVLVAFFYERKRHVRRRYSTSKHRLDPPVFLRIPAQDVWIRPEGKRPPGADLVQSTCMDLPGMHVRSQASRNIGPQIFSARRALWATCIDSCSPDHLSNDSRLFKLIAA